MPRNEALDELEEALEAQEREGGVMPARCPHCTKEFPREVLFDHMWQKHRLAMLAQRRSRPDCKNTGAANIVRGFGGTEGHKGKSDQPDSLGETVALRPADAAEQQAMPLRQPDLSVPKRHDVNSWLMEEKPSPMPEFAAGSAVVKNLQRQFVPSGADGLLTKLDRLEEMVHKSQRRHLSVDTALLEVADGILRLATLRITRG